MRICPQAAIEVAMTQHSTQVPTRLGWAAKFAQASRALE
jgi:hypothetical protein